MFPEYVKFHYDSFADVYPDSIAQAMKDVYMQLYKGYRNRQRKINCRFAPRLYRRHPDGTLGYTYSIKRQGIRRAYYFFRIREIHVIAYGKFP